jgi:hypothetical protein
MPRSPRPAVPVRQQTRITLDPSMTIAELGLLLPSEAATLLKVRESWLRKKAAARLIPCTYVGKHLRFSAHDVAAIAAVGARPATGRRPRRRSVPAPTGDLPSRPPQSVHAHHDDPEPDGSSPWHG